MSAPVRIVSSLLPRFLLLGILLALASPAAAGALAPAFGVPTGQPSLIDAPMCFDAGYPIWTTVADLNRDGKPDLANASLGTTPGVSVLLGAGDGTFGASTVYPVGASPERVEAADLNSDGKLDLVTYNGGHGTVSVLMGRGDGTFDPYVEYPTGNQPAGLAIADLNADGAPDVVVGGIGKAVFVLLGRGDGTLGASRGYPTGADVIDVAIGDVSGDGVLDVVAKASTPSAFVLLGTGDGTLTLRASYPLGGGAIKIADVNRDGNADLVTGASVLLGNGDGSFGAKLDVPASYGGWCLSVEDLNRDGIADLSFLSSGPFVHVYLGAGDGTFVHKFQYLAGYVTASVTTGDVNQDGGPDLVVSNAGHGNVVVLLGHGDGTFVARRDYQLGFYPRSVTIGNAIGDGNPDLITTGHGAWALPGKGDGTFGYRAVLTDLASIAETVVGDLNRDGWPDLAGARLDGYVSVFMGGPGGVLGAPASFPAAAGSSAIAIGDVNRDGAPDLVTASTTGNTISILLGVGDGTFHPNVDVPVGKGPASVALADVNHDDNLDVVTGNRETVSGVSRVTVSVLLGRGDGGFNPRTDYEDGGYSVAIGDLDDDGNADILTSSLALLGNGDGTFRAGPPYGVSFGSVAVGDMDRDGNLDVVGTRYYPEAVSILLGRGAGAFGPRMDYATDALPVVVKVGDLNGDGKLDVVTANAYSEASLTVLMNIGPNPPIVEAALDLEPRVLNRSSRGAFVTAYIEPAGRAASDIDAASLRLEDRLAPLSKAGAIADRDGDGLPELAVKFDRAGFERMLTAGTRRVRVSGRFITGENLRGVGEIRVIEPGANAPVVVAPNPLNPIGTLTFTVVSAGATSVRLFDAGGRLVRTLMDVPSLSAGPHLLRIDGRSDTGEALASGVYFYRVRSADGTRTGRITILK